MAFFVVHLVGLYPGAHGYLTDVFTLRDAVAIFRLSVKHFHGDIIILTVKEIGTIGIAKTVMGQCSAFCFSIVYIDFIIGIAVKRIIGDWSEFSRFDVKLQLSKVIVGYVLN